MQRLRSDGCRRPKGLRGHHAVFDEEF
jgi:hypothetical protein